MGEVIRYIKGIFRYKLTATFFIMGQLIMFFAVFGALSVYNKAYEKEKDRLESIYNERIEMSVTTINQSDIFTDVGHKVKDGNLLLAGRLSLDVAEAGVNTRVEVLLTANEELPYEIVEGHIPGTEMGDAGKRLVALGRDKYKYAYEKDGKRFITIGGDVYEVCGIIGSSDSDYWDYKVVMNVKCMGEETMKTITSQRSYTLELSSNTFDLKNSYDRIYSNIVSLDSTAVINSKKLVSKGESTVSDTMARENLRVNVIVYIFCILNCMVMSQFWIMQRRKELAIRKTFGMSNFRIIMIIAENVISLIVAAFIIFIFMIALISLINSEIVEWLNFSIATYLTIIMTIVVTAVMTMLYPIFRIIRFNPAITLADAE